MQNSKPPWELYVGTFGELRQMAGLLKQVQHRFHWKIALGVSPGTVLPFYGKTVTPYKQALRTLSGVVLSPVLQKVSRRNFYGSAPPGSKGVWLCFL